MQFNIKTIMLDTAAIAIVFLFLRSPMIAGFLLAVVLPMTMMMLALSARQVGTILDVRSRTGLTECWRIWLVSMGMILALFIAAIFVDDVATILPYR